jgi:hypothetical protein
MADLQVWTNGDDWVVAESEADATSIVVDLMGYETGPWEPLARDSVLTLTTDDGGKEAKTCAEWAAEGRGHLASVNL